MYKQYQASTAPQNQCKTCRKGERTFIRKENISLYKVNKKLKAGIK